jgi:hypothetical protein
LALRFNIGRAIGKRWRVPESTAPIFELVSDGTELSDGAIASLAALLLDAADRAGQTAPLPTQAELATSRPAMSKRRRQVLRKEAQGPAK